MTKATWKSKDLEFKLHNPKDSALLIKSAQVSQVFEFAKDELIIHLAPTDLLIAKEMQVIARVNDPDAGNHNKYQITMLPSFDADTFPFIALSGAKTLNIMNIKTQMMQPLVDTEVAAYAGQQSFFFKKEKKGFSFQFVTYTKDDEN